MTGSVQPSGSAGKPARPIFEDGRYVWERHYPEGVEWAFATPPRPLWSLLDEAARKFSARPAIWYFGREWSYGQLAGLVDRVARGLQDIGVKKGSKVGLFLPNTPYAAIFYYGVLKAGGTVVNYNPLYVDRELSSQIEDSGTEIMVTVDLKLTCDKMEKMLHATRLQKVIICPMGDAFPFPKNLLFPIVKRKDMARPRYDGRYLRYADIIANKGDFARVEIDPVSDVAVLQYTGGTTGVPKGAMLTHANIYCNTLQVSGWLRGVKEGHESMLGVLPLFHVFAMTVVLNMAFHYGMKIYLQPKFDLDEAMKLIARERPTYFPAVPAIFNAIGNHPDVARYDFSSLKFCLSGGAPLPAEVKRLFSEKTGVKTVGEGYGLTESSPVATCNPVFGRVKTGSAGQPVPGTVIDIIDRNDGVTVLGLGEKGEICIRGPQVMKGYYNRPAETAEVIRNGRLHTGDVGYIDEEGYLFIVDRIKDLILVRGYNVYPRQVEEAIYLHPSVEECIVAGVPDAERGETVWAWIKLVPGRTLAENDLHEFLKDKLSPIEMPRKVIFRDKPLPKTMIGKPSRKDLLEQEGIKRT